MSDDLELIRCPSCRGRKQVEKLGGVIGECNTCKGDGKIKQCDKPSPPMSNHDAVYGSANKVDIVAATARAVPNQVDPLESAQSKLQDETTPEPILEVESKSVVKRLNAQGKRAVFKRKQE